jgi:hypothetical protein
VCCLPTLYISSYADGRSGGGGLKSPYLANLATSLNYAISTLVTLVGGPIINKIGIKWACILAALTFPLAGSGYYSQARFQLSAYLLTARVCGPLTTVTALLLIRIGCRRYWVWPTLRW